MAIDISVTIMAHEKRAPWVEELVEKLDAPATVVWDQKNDVWDTGRRALLEASGDYHIVIQDDTEICRDLVAGVRKLTEFVPRYRPICLYYGSRMLKSDYGRMYRQTKNENCSWLVLQKSIVWGIGLVIPIEHIEPIVEYGDYAIVTRGAIYDGRIRFWYHRHGIEQWYPIPSLVDHRSALEGKESIMGRNNTPNRVAFEFVGSDKSALDINWTDKAIWPDWHLKENKKNYPRMKHGWDRTREKPAIK